MSEQFAFDVFLSHSQRDASTARELAHRLQEDGLRVCSGDGMIKAGQDVSTSLEEGLERSRVLVLCMSANAFGEEWGQLEAGTFRFRDPRDNERRFIPLRLDDAPIKDSVSQFLSVSWLPEDREREYPQLLERCRLQAKLPPVGEDTTPEHTADTAIRLTLDEQFWVYAFSPDGRRVLTGTDDNEVRLWSLRTGRSTRVLKGHTGPVWCVAWSADKRRAVSGSNDTTIRLWDINTGECLRVLTGHRRYLQGLAWASDQHRILSAAQDETVRLWDVETGDCLRVFEGHSGDVETVAWSPDNRHALSGADDNTLRIWDIESGRCLRVLAGHTRWVWAVVWSPDGRRALSGSIDHTARVWEIESGRCLQVLEGHQLSVRSVAWSPDGRLALSSADDNTIRMWDVETGLCLRVLKGHQSEVKTVAWSRDGKGAISGDRSGEVRTWKLADLAARQDNPQAAAPSSVPAEVHYANAKVLLVGDSGVGKSGLSNFLAQGLKVEDERPIPSTDGAWATHWPLLHTGDETTARREIWLWDFAGQVDYRLVHQLFMDDTAAAVLVFNPQNENPFEALGQWDRDLQKAARKPFAKLLAAGRTDRGGLVVSSGTMEKFMAERGFVPPLHLTSAKTAEGCEGLRQAIVAAIDWETIPETTSPLLYQRMKQQILSLRDRGVVLMRLAELKQHIEMNIGGQDFTPEELEAVVDLLSGPGMIKRLHFGGFILLRPEVLSRYAAAVVRKVRQHPQEMGCMLESEMLAGDLDYQDFTRLPKEDEAVVLRTLLETLISRAWCLRQASDSSAILTFPSYFRRERNEQPSHPTVLVTYRFDGPRDDIYATLVVRLHHTVAFQSTALWKSAADFKTQTGAALGFRLTNEPEGASRLQIYFEPDVDLNSRVLFLRYVQDHLTAEAQNVVRLRHYVCSNKQCDAYGQRFSEQSKIDKALGPGGKGKVYCPECGRPIILHDLIEEKLDGSLVKLRAREMLRKGQTLIDNESKDLILTGHAYAITGEAGQIYRGYTGSDHGIDGEIEFKDDAGRASGQRLYLQLKSGDSYLKKRSRDEAKVFQIKNLRWADYWQQQAYTVMLVIRTSDGEILWMDVSAYLKREASKGRKVKQIVFSGERFDAMSVRRWRDRYLGAIHP
jgi:hypothetical protein